MTKLKLIGSYDPWTETLVEAKPPEFSEESLALRFAEQHALDLRYVDMWSKWLIWDDKRWMVDETRKAFDQSRTICRTASAECNTKHRSQLASAKTVAATLSLARSDRRIAGTIEQWDSDPWLLNTPGGIVDLSAGQSRQAIPQDYMTKMTAVAPGGDCPGFLSFLDEITAGDGALCDFLQRMFGYCITGCGSRHRHLSR